MDNMIEVTQELIERGQSGAGGWNQDQLKILGVDWPPQHGWRRRTRRWISEIEADQFIRLKGVPLKERKLDRKRVKSQIWKLSQVMLNFDADP